jgi:hypothetical protein
MVDAPGVGKVYVVAAFSNTQLADWTLTGAVPSPLACHSSSCGWLATRGLSSPPLSAPLLRWTPMLPASDPPVVLAVRLTPTVKIASPPAGA